MKRLFCLAAVAIAANGAIATAASAATLNGAGSTLVAPLVSEWKTGFQNANSGATVNYASVGSGTGISDISHGVVDFGASDAPMTSAQAGGCSGCITIPWALSATGIGYNIPGVKSGLHLTGPILAQIYLGQITTWNASAIAKLNKEVKLPNLKITPVFRSDGSGDTYAFTNFLSHVSSTWASSKAYATTVNFTVGIGGKGNSGVASAVSSTSGSIGYISGSYLIAQHITYAAVENAAGNFEYPNLNSILNAASSVTSAALGGVQTNGLPIVNPPKSKKIAYPISTFTYAIVKSGSANSSLLKQFLTFAVTTGRQFGVGADFAPIPAAVQSYDETEIGKL
jgi:phosphate transport system substrate-binding protein